MINEKWFDYDIKEEIMSSTSTLAGWFVVGTGEQINITLYDLCKDIACTIIDDGLILPITVIATHTREGIKEFHKIMYKSLTQLSGEEGIISISYSFSFILSLNKKEFIDLLTDFIQDSLNNVNLKKRFSFSIHLCVNDDSVYLSLILPTFDSNNYNTKRQKDGYSQTSLKNFYKLLRGYNDKS